MNLLRTYKTLSNLDIPFGTRYFIFFNGVEIGWTILNNKSLMIEEIYKTFKCNDTGNTIRKKLLTEVKVNGSFTVPYDVLRANIYAASITHNEEDYAINYYDLDKLGSVAEEGELRIRPENVVGSKYDIVIYKASMSIKENVNLTGQEPLSFEINFEALPVIKNGSYKLLERRDPRDYVNGIWFAGGFVDFMVPIQIDSYDIYKKTNYQFGIYSTEFWAEQGFNNGEQKGYYKGAWYTSLNRLSEVDMIKKTNKIVLNTLETEKTEQLQTAKSDQKAYLIAYSSNTMDIYNFVTGTLGKKYNVVPSNLQGSAAIFANENQAYFAGGSKYGNYTENTIAILDFILETTVNVSQQLTQAKEATAVAYNEDLAYIVGGYIRDSEGTSRTNEIEKYDMNTDTSILIAATIYAEASSMVGKRVGQTGVFCYGYFVGEGKTKNIHYLDFDTETFTKQATQLLTSRSDFTSF